MKLRPFLFLFATACSDAPATLIPVEAGAVDAHDASPPPKLDAGDASDASTVDVDEASTSVLGAKLVAGYWQMYQGPNVSEITANAPQYNLQYAAFAWSTSSGTGNVDFSPSFEKHDALKKDIAASQAAGSVWLLSVGGGGDDGLQLTSSTDATQLVNSVIPIIDDYGFQGLDFDLENGPDGWDVTVMKSVATQLKAHYGKDFVISSAPRPYEDYYRDWAVAMGDALDLFGYQFYDFPEANNASTLKSIIDSRIDEAVGLGIPASKLMIGCITYSGYQAGHNTPETYRDIFKGLEAKYPDLRGVYVWETSLDKLDSWAFAKVMGKAVRGL